MKMQVMEMMSAMCVYSHDGHQLVLDTLEHLRVSCVVHSARLASHPQQCSITNSVSFFNVFQSSPFLSAKQNKIKPNEQKMQSSSHIQRSTGKFKELPTTTNNTYFSCSLMKVCCIDAVCCV